jgi:Ca2+-binding EF-hand superfamily protein
MTLTKAEFAEALGMRVDDLFVQRMFSCMTRGEQLDSVCFQEFLEVLRKFTRGLSLSTCKITLLELLLKIYKSYRFFEGETATNLRYVRHRT